MFRISKPALKEVYDVVSKASDLRAQMPVLKCVLVTSGKDGTVFHATNLEVFASVLLTTTSEQDMTAVIPADIIRDLLKDRSHWFEFDIDGQVLQVKGQSGVEFLHELPISPEDYPVIPETGKWTGTNTIDKDMFVSGTTKVMKAVSGDESRRNLSGVYYHKGKAHATDGYRAHIADVGPCLHGLVPRDSIKVILHALKFDAGVELKYNDMFVQFDNGRVRVLSRLIDETFPDVMGLYPKEVQVEYDFTSKSLADTLKALLPHTNKATKCVAFDFNGSKVTVSTKHPEKPTVSRTINYRKLKGHDSFHVRFNAQFLLDLVENSGMSFQLGMNDNLSCARVTTTPSDFTGLLMPIRPDDDK